MKKFHDKVVYQIYPKSFMDCNNDGFGDLKGIISKLDYIKELGADMIWLCPIYPSPGFDNGYDVADYKSIAKEYGTMEDFENLVQEAKKRGIGIMMDMVFNHTSWDHEWFQKALKNDEKYKNYYIFKDPVNQKEPTNWQSKFGGSAWQYVPELNQYYLHIFDKSQPDLNWENPEVRKEAADIVKFWMDRGVKGFRFDVVNLISKSTYEDDDIWDGRRFYTDGPRIHEFLHELNQNSFGQDENTLTVGEMNSTSLKNCCQYANPNNQELDMVFSFHHLKADYEDNGISKEKWVDKKPDILLFKNILFEWQTKMQEAGSWNAVFLNCHDQPRSLSRFGDDVNYRNESGKALATMIHMLRGTPYIFQGEEIGMKNAGFEDLSMYRDVESLNAYNILKEKGHTEKEIFKILGQKSRDNARTPMRWMDTKNAGFSKAEPWIPSPKDDPSYTASAQSQDANSIFAHYKKLIQLRKEHTCIQDGRIEPILEDHESVVAYRRKDDQEEALILVNVSDQKAEIQLEDIEGFKPVISSYDSLKEIHSPMILEPFEAIVYFRQK